MISALAAVGALLASVTSVSAHGYVQELTAGTTKYTGYLPYSDPYYSPAIPRVVRAVPGNGPVTDLSLIDVQCNGYTAGGVIGSSPAALVATVAAGSTVSLNWTTWPDTHKGPLLTYIAAAPSDITKWSPGSSAVWAKIAQSTYANGQWASDALIAANGIYKFTIPASLKPGQYLIRHEIIALHSAYTYPGAQVYPMCLQIQVTGSGTKVPTNLVSFPGAYTGTSSGIIYDVYTKDGSAYVAPGPTVWSG